MSHKLQFNDAPATAPHPSSEGMCGWLPQAERALQEIADWPENWDSYGAAAPRMDAIQAAVKLVREAACHCALPEPYISATRSGGVFVQWTANEHEVDVSIESEVDVTFAYENTETRQRLSGRVEGERSAPTTLYDALDTYFCN